MTTKILHVYPESIIRVVPNSPYAQYVKKDLWMLNIRLQNNEYGINFLDLAINKYQAELLRNWLNQELNRKI